MNHDADAFLRYFDEKVRTVRAATDGRPAPAFTPATAESLSVLSPCSKTRSGSWSCSHRPSHVQSTPFLLSCWRSWSIHFYRMLLPWSMPRCARDICRQNRSALLSLRCWKNQDWTPTNWGTIDLSPTWHSCQSWWKGSSHRVSSATSIHTVWCHSYSPHTAAITVQRLHY